MKKIGKTLSEHTLQNVGPVPHTHSFRIHTSRKISIVFCVHRGVFTHKCNFKNDAVIVLKFHFDALYCVGIGLKSRRAHFLNDKFASFCELCWFYLFIYKIQTFHIYHKLRKKQIFGSSTMEGCLDNV